MEMAIIDLMKLSDSMEMELAIGMKQVNDTMDMAMGMKDLTIELLETMGIVVVQL